LADCIFSYPPPYLPAYLTDQVTKEPAHYQTD
jgi:hypothetical protein